MENQQEDLSQVEIKSDDDSTITDIDLTSVPEEDRSRMLILFYSLKFLFIILFVIFTFVLTIYGVIDQYIYATVSVAALGAYITGKIDKIAFWRKK